MTIKFLPRDDNKSPKMFFDWKQLKNTLKFWAIHNIVLPITESQIPKPGPIKLNWACYFTVLFCMPILIHEFLGFRIGETL